MPLWWARLPVSSTEVDSVRFLLDRGVTLSWLVVGESTRAVPMETVSVTMPSGMPVIISNSIETTMTTVAVSIEYISVKP